MSDDVIRRTVTPARPAAVTLAIDRPAVRNALRPADVQALNRHLLEVQEDPAIKVVFLTGMADAFCAGADINYINALSGPELAAFIDSQAEALMRIVAMPKVVIAAVNGVTAGMGNHIAICSDLCVAVPDAVFNFTGAARALPSMLLGALVMPMMTGLKRAKAIYLRGGRIPAPQAVEYGFCNEIIARAEWDRGLDALATEFAARDAATLAHNKFQLNQGVFQMLGPLKLSILAGAAALSPATSIPTGRQP